MLRGLRKKLQPIEISPNSDTFHNKNFRQNENCFFSICPVKNHKGWWKNDLTERPMHSSKNIVSNRLRWSLSNPFFSTKPLWKLDKLRKSQIHFVWKFRWFSKGLRTEYESLSKKRYVQPGFHQKHARFWQIDGRTQLTGFLTTNDVYKATGKNPRWFHHFRQ